MSDLAKDIVIFGMCTTLIVGIFASRAVTRFSDEWYDE